MATTKVTTDVIDMSGNAGGLTWVKGTTAQKPSGVIGEIRENTETNRTEVYTNQVSTPPTISTCDYPAGAGAQALYQFDTATLTTDTCGNYSAGTNNNVTQNTTVKKFGTSSAEFNGTTSDIDLEAGLDSTTMSVSFWIYIDATITTSGVVVELENGYGVWFIATASGKLGVQNNNTNNQATLSNAQLGTGAWHHVAAVWTGVGGSSNRTFYLDNVVQTGGTVSDYLTCNENTLGSRRSGEFFDGYLDQVRFYNTALTASQVDNLFNESSTSTGNEWRNLKEAAIDNSFQVDYLVVAGGGGGGGESIAGGGGAGGYLTSEGYSTVGLDPAVAYTIQVGPGGAGGSGVPGAGVSGTDSIFQHKAATITTTGGGGGAGGGQSGGNPLNGGSGGGGGYVNYTSGGLGNTPSTTPSQGNNGGSGVSNNSGGGGGAGQVGNVNGAARGGDGKITTLITTTIAAAQSVGQVSGSDVYFAGGGGGSTPFNTVGGLGGGGTSSPSGGAASSPATAKTGGGGGGGYTGGNGGSGIIILSCSKTSATFTSGVTCNGTSGGGTINGISNGSAYVYIITVAGSSQTITFS